jgi:hypothetical protein
MEISYKIYYETVFYCYASPHARQNGLITAFYFRSEKKLVSLKFYYGTTNNYKLLSKASINLTQNNTKFKFFLN